MSTRNVLLAACVVARDPRVDVGAVLDVWARECPAALHRLELTSQLALAAVREDVDSQHFMQAVLRGLRAGVAAGCHMGTRVNGRSDDEPIELSERSAEGARKLAHAADDAQLLVSSDLGAFLTIARAGLATHLEPARVRFADGTAADAFRVKPAVAPSSVQRSAAPPTAAPTTPVTFDSVRRSQLIERLGLALTPYLGPIAPLMLRRLPSGRMSARDFIDAILKDVPAGQYEPVKRAIEEEIRRLR
jgi:hypothetical protein